MRPPKKPLRRPRGRSSACSPTPSSSHKPERGELTNIDMHIGGRLRERRLSLAQTGRELAKLIGVSGQQLHKYETGASSISASQAYSLAQVLGVSVSYFFVGADDRQLRAFNRRDRLLLEFMRNVAEISDEARLQAILQVVRLLVPPSEQPRPDTLRP